ncbi:MAG: pyruvate kinase, partial [Clostridia bacterium]|nr:pyruvate kinase [Clostridia bacterium]
EQVGLAANKQWAEVGRRSITDSIGHATCLIAREVGASAILTPTTSGFTPRMVSKYRPSVPIVAATPDARVQRMLALVWGVVSVLVPEETGTDETIASAVKAALELGLIKTGDLIVVTAGVPVGVPGTTNLVKVHLVGDVLAAGTGVGQSVARGPAKIVWDSREVDKVNEGDILVTRATNEDFVPAIRKAAGIVAELGGLTSHAAIAGLSMKIPVIVGAEGILGNVRDGEVITVDSRRGYVYRG